MNCKVCHNLSVKNPDLSFFRFPSDYNRCRDWAKLCDLLPVFDKCGPGKFYKSYRICSEHFESKHITFDGKKKKLLSGAVPKEYHRKETLEEGAYDSRDANSRPKPSVCVVSKQFRNLCRFCAEEGSKLTDIFSWKGKTLKLEEKIKVFPIRVKYDSYIIVDKQDELPLKICRRCIFKITKFYEFVNNCLKADLKLKKILGYYQHKIFGSNSKTREKLKLADAKKAEKPKPVPLQESNTVSDTAQNQEKNVPAEGYKKSGILKPRFIYLHSNPHLRQGHGVGNESEKSQTEKEGNVTVSCSSGGETSSNQKVNSNKELIEEKSSTNSTNIYNPIYEKLNINKYTCSQCSKHFCNSEILESHAKAHSLKPDEQGRFVCQTCDKVFLNKYRLNEHNRVHTGECPFKCSMCNKRFHKGALLRQHLLVHETGKRFACSVCDLRSSRKGNLIQHLKNHYKKLQNENSDAKLNEQTYLITGDMADVTRKGLIGESISTEFVPMEGDPPVTDFQIQSSSFHTYKFMCGLCEKQFLDLDSIESHFRLHTCENLVPSQDEKTTEGKKPRKTTGGKAKGNERNFQCEECGLKFKRKDTLTNHFRIHTGERPFMCKICGFTFKQRGDCLKHERNHSKDDDFHFL